MKRDTVSLIVICADSDEAEKLHGELRTARDTEDGIQIGTVDNSYHVQVGTVVR